MKIKNKLIILSIISLSFIFAFSNIAFAKSNTLSAQFAGMNLSIPKQSDGCDNNNNDPCLSSVALLEWVTFFINYFVLIAIVGSAVMIAWAGVEYITAGGNSEKTKAAKDKIKNVVIGMLCLVFMWSFIQWLIPGGSDNIEIPKTNPQTINTNASSNVSLNSNNSASTQQDTKTVTTLDVDNFRDAGASGFLKKGVLYRSANLNTANTNQVGALLGNGTIIDLRTASVKNKYPDISVSSVNYINIPIHGTTDYTEFVTNSDSRKAFGRAITTIAESDGRVLLHCTYGKDRTGWAVAMIMYALGASKAQVKSEYLKSGGVNEAMLNAGLSKAKAKYGSIDNYIHKGLGVSDSTIADLKAKLGN